MASCARTAASSRSRARAARTAVCWRPIVAMIAVLVSMLPAPGAAAEALLRAREKRGDLDAQEHEEVARERVAVDVQVRLLDVVAQSASRRAASSAAAAQSAWGATVVTNGRLVSAMRRRPGGAPTSAANGRAGGGAQ